MVKFWKNIRLAWRDFRAAFRQSGLRVFLSWLVFAVLTALAIGWFDDKSVRFANNFEWGWLTKERIHALADIIYKYGDFGFFTLSTAAFFFILGLVKRNPYLKRLAATLLVAGLVSGVGVRVLKICVGRPRPPVVQRGETTAWHLIGPTFKAKWNSYPSGHSASAATGCAVIALALPRLLPVLLVFVGTVGLSRIAYNQHYPTDVLHGVVFGVVVALLCASHLADIRRRIEARTRGKKTAAD